MNTSIAFVAAGFLLASSSALAAPETAPRVAAPLSEADAVRAALVTLDVTFQEWAFDEPWRKRQPGTRSGNGLVLGDGRVLTTAGVVAGATLVELHRGVEPTPYRARVVMADALANLALVAPEDPAFFQGLSALPFADAQPSASDPVKASVHRIRNGRRVESLSASVVDLEANEPGAGGAQLLTMGLSLQMEGGGLAELVTRDGKLLGLSYARYGEKLMALPASVLRTWLTDAKRGDARRGFAAAGWRWQPLTNPELRAHLGVPKGREGILVNKVWPYATGAGVLQDGDVLLNLAGRDIDARGNFEHPVYGPARFGLLLTEGRVAGDQIEAEIVRAKATKRETLTLAPDAPNRRVVPTLPGEKQPRYLVRSGLVFQELSAPYLKAFGDSGPLRLAIQNELYGAMAAGPERQRFVVLTQVLPDAATVGYESVRNRLVSTVYGRAVQSLVEVDAALLSLLGRVLRDVHADLASSA